MKTGNIFYDNLPKIEQEKYKILFEDKSSWFTVDKDGNQDWSISYEKQIQFWETIEKVKEFFENMPNVHHMPAFYDFSFIRFPEMSINDCRVISPSQLLSEFSDACLFANFYKAIFYGKVIITNSKFKIDLDFRECKFKNVFLFVGNEIKSIDFSNAIFDKKTEMRQSIFNGGVKFNKTNFHDDIKLEELHFQDNVNLSIKSKKESNFNDLICEKIATFGGAIFIGPVTFNNCKFNNFTDFTKTAFTKQVFLSNVFFHDVYFLGTFFLDNITFLFLQADSFIMRECAISHLKINNSFIKNSDIDRLFFISVNDKKNEVIPLSSRQIADRQTARFLKNLYENQKNIPNSNQLFAIEQDYFIKELQNDNISNQNKLSTLATLYLNKLISNFGIDWILPILVLIFFGYFAGLLYAFFQTGYEDICFRDATKVELLFAGLGISGLFYLSYLKKSFYYMWFFGLMYIFITLVSTDFRQINNDISKLINPLEMFKDKNYFDNLAILGIFYKTVVATLIYQFLVAFRQNTRRS